MGWRKGRSLVLAVLVLACLGLALGPGEVCAQTSLGVELVQELSASSAGIPVLFDNPEGSVVGLKGSTVFVSNAAWDENVLSPTYGTFPVGAGYITKLTIGADGQLTVVDPQFVTDLTKPWGMAVLPKTVRGIHKGTVFVGHGDGPDGGSLTEVVAFDPRTGSPVGSPISLGDPSPFKTISGTSGKVINALAFDAAGNLYITDTGIVDRIAQGVWKVEASRLPNLLGLDGSIVPSDETGLWFVPLQGGPDGVEVSPDGELYVNTVGQFPAEIFNLGAIYDPYYGAIYNLTDADFEAGCDPGDAECRHVGYPLNPPLFEGLGALDGLVFTPGGTMLNTEPLITGDIVAITPGGAPMFLGVTDLSGPADISVAEKGNKTYVIIPEHTSWGAALPENDQVTVIQLLGAP